MKENTITILRHLVLGCMKTAICCGLLCIIAAACTDENKNKPNNDEEDTIPKPVFIDITFNSSAAIVDIPATAIGVSCASGNNTNVVLALDSAVLTEYIYRVSGSTTSGSLTINSNYKLTLLLNGVDLTSTTTSPPLHINCGKRISMILQEGTDNTFTDNATNEKKGAVYTKGHLEIEGGGTLNIRGKARHALCAKEYLQLKKSTGTINILESASDGIHCGEGDGNPENNYFRMSGGTLNFNNVTSDLIDCDDYGNAFINGGTLNLNVDAIGGKGLKADSLLYVTGGTINLDLTGTSAVGLQSNYKTFLSGGTINGTVSCYDGIGIRTNNAKSSLTVLNGGYLYISGSNIDLKLTGSSCYGINAEADMEVTAGNINLQGLAANAPGYKVKGTASGDNYIKWTATDE